MSANKHNCCDNCNKSDFDIEEEEVNIDKLLDYNKKWAR